MPGKQVGSILALGFQAREVDPGLAELAGDCRFSIAQRLQAFAGLNTLRFSDSGFAGQLFDRFTALGELGFGLRLGFLGGLPFQVCEESLQRGDLLRKLLVLAGLARLSLQALQLTLHLSGHF